jgi:hypothetical protein
MTILGGGLLVLLGLASTGASPSPEEQKAFTEGLRLFQSGDPRGAERIWKAGYAVGHDPAFLVRIGEAEEKAGAPKEALAAYERYLRESPDASDRDDIEARLRRLRPAPAAPAPGSGDVPGEMSPAAGSQGAGAPIPAAAPVAPRDGLSSTGAAGATPNGAAGPSTGTVTARSPQAPDEGEDLRAFVEENPSPQSRLNVAAWVGTGLTVALLGVAAFYAARAGEKSGDVTRLLTNTAPMTGVPPEYSAVAAAYESDVRDGRQADRLAKGFAIGGAVAAVGATALFIIDALRTPEPAGGGAVHARRTPPPGRLRPIVPPLREARLPGLGLGWSF